MTASDPSKLKVRKEFSVSGIAFCVARVPQTGTLFYGNSDFKVYEVDALAEKPAPKPLSGDGHQSYVTGITLANGQLVSGSYDGRLIWWNTESKEQVRAIDAHKLWIRRVLASPDGSLVASVADDMICRVWDAKTGEKVHELVEHKPKTPHNYPSMLYAVTFSHDGQWMATADKTGHIAVWEVASGRKRAELKAPVMYTWDPKQRRHSIGGIRSLQFSHDDKLLAAGGIGKIGNIDHLGGPSRIEVFDWQQNKRIHEIEDGKLKGLVEQIAFDPDGQWLLGAGGDHGGFVSFYNLKDGKLIHQLKAPMHVHQFAMNEEHNGIFAVGHGKIAHFEFAIPRAEAPPLPEKKA